MRLTCPRCRAQYDIPDSVIPASGREVECSSCSQVWRQPGTDPARNTTGAAKASDENGQYDPSARPALNRPLHESILSVLREETARELSARASETRNDPPQHDHNRAKPDAAPASAPLPGAALPQGDEIDWPVTTVILPGDPLPVSDRDQTEAPESPAPDPEPAAEPPLTGRQDETPPAGAAPEVVITPPPPPPLQPASLPDAEVLAATLTRKVVPAAPAKTDAVPDAETAEKIRPAASLRPSDVSDQPVQKPAPLAVSAPASRRGYKAGLALALVLGLGLAASYLAVPREAAPQWHQQIDQARIWLQENATALRDRLMRN